MSTTIIKIFAIIIDFFAILGRIMKSKFMVMSVCDRLKEDILSKKEVFCRCVILMLVFCAVLCTLLFVLCQVTCEGVFACETEGCKRENGLVVYDGEVIHLFTHCLVANPDIAFRASNDMAVHYDADCLVPCEFKKILTLLYQNDYVLCDIAATYEIENGKAKKKEFLFPEGKKPLVLSFDDVVYDPKKSGKGMADRLVVQDGKIGAETFGEGISFDNEFVCILESFIENNPDFAFEGARGILCLTGFSGVLGYRTQEGSENRESEILKASEVLDCLKSSGWRFASHSFAHGHMKAVSDEKFAADVSKWKNQVESIIGKTDLYVYPYGEWVISENINGENTTCAKHKNLVDAGFNVFFGVGAKPFYSYLPFSGDDKYLFMDRCSLDGVTLRSESGEIDKYFDPKLVIDEAVREIK